MMFTRVPSAMAAKGLAVAAAALLDALTEDETAAEDEMVDREAWMGAVAVSLLLGKLGEDAGSERFEFCVQPATRKMFWTVPGFDEPDEDGNCKCCGKPMDDD
jgi:hypothetical protein